MSEKSDNRRRYPRTIFSDIDGVFGQYFNPGKKRAPLTVQILNICEEGLFFSLHHDQAEILKEGDTLRFVSIKIWETVILVTNIKVTVVWLCRDIKTNDIGVGCKINKISDTSRSIIRQIVDFRERMVLKAD